MWRSLVFSLAAVCLVDAAAAAKEPWDGPFEGTPQAILKAAGQLPPAEQADVELLLEDIRFEVDDQRRIHRSRRQVIRFLTDDGVRIAGVAETPWSKWHEERPAIRARVISPTGKVHQFDPATAGEAPTDANDQVFSDLRMLRAPLPGLSPGAIAEVEITVRESRPFFEPGSLKRMMGFTFLPVRERRLQLDWPLAMPVKFETRGFDREPQRSEADGRGRLTCSTGPLRALTLAELEPFGARPDEKATLVFTTGKSWHEIAKGYHELVEKQLENFDAAQAAGEPLGGKSREETVRLVLARVQALIRYTGLAFGEAAIVPYRPAETLARRYGDCKDQSILCVALLRAAGVPAQVALINTGDLHDLNPTLPALNCFDHAIVYVPGDSPLWVDPTAGKIRTGVLPAALQGRWALIIDPKTASLTRTPQAKSAENRCLDTAEINLHEWRNTRVTRKIECWGTLDHEYRTTYNAPLKDVRQYWEQLGRSVYQTQNLTSLQLEPVEDVTRPFRLEARFDGVSVGETNGNFMRVWIPLGNVLERLPGFLWLPPDGERTRRKSPMQLSDLHRLELVQRLIPPGGFELDELPKGERLQFGPATLSWEIARLPNGSAAAHVIFDTGTGAFTPSQVDDLRQGLADLPRDPAGAPGVMVEFRHVVSQRFNAGEIREAAAAALRLAREEPGYAWHHIRLGNLLSQLSLNEAAIAAFRKAIELEPKSAPAHHHLGVALLCDPLGRHWLPGFDRTGAMESLRKAQELDPGYNSVKLLWCVMHEYDEHGARYSPGALPGALAEYRRWKQVSPDILANYGDSYLGSLCHAHKFADVQNIALSFPGGQAAYLAATAMLRGVPAAETKAAELARTRDARRQLLLTTSNYLQQIRCYPQAAEILERNQAGEPNAFELQNRAALYRRLARIEDHWLLDTDPAYPVQRLYYWMLWSGPQHPEVSSLFREPPDLEGSLLRLEEITGALRRQGANNSPNRRADILTLVKFRTTGDDAFGYRVRVERLDNRDQAAWFVVKTPAGYRLWDVGPTSAELGVAALKELAAGRTTAAVQYLDWAVAEQKRTFNVFQPFSALPVVSLWTSADREKADDIRVAALTLAAYGPAQPEVCDALLAAREGASTSRQVQIDRALLEAGGKAQRHADVAAAAARLVAVYPNETEPVLAWVHAEAERGQQAEARRTAEAWLTNPETAQAGRLALAYLSARSGDYPQTAKHLLEAVKRRSTPPLLNELAWAQLCLDEIPPDAVVNAQMAVEKLRIPATLNTLAVAEAAANNLLRAQELLLECVNLRGRIDTADWCVQGLIAEKYGLADAAAGAYRKVVADQGCDQTLKHLAERGLARLQNERPTESGR